MLVEQGSELRALLMRQLLRTHRPFAADVLSLTGKPLLSFSRPFFFINSTISARDAATSQTIGEVHQRWHLWRRNYDLFTGKKQFGLVEGEFLAVQFRVLDARGAEIARVDKDFTGLAREIFTDARQYVIHFDPGHVIPPGTSGAVVTPSRVLTYDERAVVLAMAVSIDFDYFSLHGGPSPFFWMLGGGGDD